MWNATVRREEWKLILFLVRVFSFFTGFLVITHALAKERYAPIACSIEGLAVVRGQVVFGASPEWFGKQDVTTVFQLHAEPAPSNTIWIGPSDHRQYLVVDRSGRVVLDGNLTPNAYWTFTSEQPCADEWRTQFIYDEMTLGSRRTEFSRVVVYCLQPARDPITIRDKDGQEREVYPAIASNANEKVVHVVTRIEPAVYSPSLEAGSSWVISGLKSVRGDVYFSFDGLKGLEKESLDLWRFDRIYITQAADNGPRFLAVDEEGYAFLAERIKINAFWSFSRPKGEAGETALRHKRKGEQAYQYLVPDDEPTILKDPDGNDVKLFRAKLGKELRKYKVWSISP